MLLSRRGCAWTCQGARRYVHASICTRRVQRKSIKDLPVHAHKPIPLKHSEPGGTTISHDWPPLALGVLENMRAFPKCILLTRVGGFYESYFDQAPTVAQTLSIKLASRKWAGQSIPMAGFPIHQLEKYLKVLVQDCGMLVAICDEFKTSLSSGAPSFQRRVTRVVSPGTLIDERFLDPFHNNFILAVSSPPPLSPTPSSSLPSSASAPGSTLSAGRSYGLAWLDVSTADFGTVVHNDEKTLRDEIVRLAPREVVLIADAFDASHPVFEATNRVQAPVAFVPTLTHAQENMLGVSQANLRDAERKAIEILTSYLQTRLLEHMPGMSVCEEGGSARASGDYVMHLDAATLNALEIRETQDHSARGSLVSIVRRTVTQGGARLCVQWLTQPSMSLRLIRARHALVELFLQRSFLRQDLRVLLRTGVGDIMRTLQRISLRRNDEQDLLEIRDFIRTSERLVASLASIDVHELHELLQRFTALHALGERLEMAIDERVMEKRIQQQEARLQTYDAMYAGGPMPPAEASAPSKRTRRTSSPPSLTLPESMWGDNIEHLIRPDASPLLLTLTNEFNALRAEARTLENALRAEHSEPVTLRFLLGQGHVVHFPSVRGHVSESLSLAYKTKTTRTYYHAEWTRIGTQLQKLRDQLSECERRMLETLRLEVLEHTAALRRNARLVDQLDVLLGFAQVAEELSLVRPQMDESTSFDIKGGRHLGVEMGLLERERLFTKNDLELGGQARLHLVTGPNMGGKSTFLRQNAVMAVLAQAGSFVPAESARLGLVDAIFSRVGAKDDLFHSRSTFMVEMAETAELLHRATQRSFVIADEIGRGTNTSVGLSVAFAVLYTLAMRIQCRSLFATHYYELADILEKHPSSSQLPQTQALRRAVGFFCTRLEQRSDGALLFSHRVRPGVNRASHGLDIARLADMPPDTMELAVRTHSWLVKHGQAHMRTHGLVDQVLMAL